MKTNKSSHEFLLPKNESRTSSNKPAMQDFLGHWVSVHATTWRAKYRRKFHNPFQICLQEKK
jgi:hypothetical protein